MKTRTEKTRKRDGVPTRLGRHPLRWYGHIASQIIIYFVLICIGFVYLEPIFEIIAKSFMSADDIVDPSTTWIPKQLSLENLKIAADVLNLDETLISTILFSGTLAQTFVSALTGFALSRYEFKGKGTWPAIWMLPTDWAYGDWPASGEIDIMEHVGYDQDVIVQSAHNNRFHAGNAYNHSTRVEGVSEEFHVYGLEWLPDKLIFTIDGEVQNIYAPNTVTSQVTKDHWPYDKRMHLLINLAFGGDWGGAMGVDDSYLPVEYYIDYVCIYQSPEIMELTGQE